MNQEEINNLIQDQWIQKVIASNEFFFQKGQDTLKQWLEMEVDDELRESLINFSTDYTQFLEISELEPNFEKIKNLLFEIISYCDDKARDKHLYNQYGDKRILAKASVRMNNWVDGLIKLKFKNGEIKAASIRNAFDYLLSPQDNSTILSSNHREMIAENLLDKKLDPQLFVKELKDYFKPFNLNVKNQDNYTYLLSCIIYSIKDKWQDEVVGLMASDSTGWQANELNLDAKWEGLILWNSKKPTRGPKVLKFLKNKIEDTGYFPLYYSVNKEAIYCANIIDLAINQKELDTINSKYNTLKNFNSDFNGYTDGKKSARIVFVAEGMEKIAPIPVSDFDFYKCKAPRQDNLSPIKNILEVQKRTIHHTSDNMPKELNQILFGPPGTGKTYNTINKALELCGEDLSGLSRNNIQKLYKKRVKEGRIVFTTFHQSFSYEDFVEGIKPVLDEADNNTISYTIEDGIFKKLCEKAKVLKSEQLDFNWENRSFYKMSLGGKSNPEIHSWCLNENKLALGWGSDNDYSNLKKISSWEQFRTKFKQDYPELEKESTFNKSAIFRFLKMKVGDVVVATIGNKIIDSVGVVTGEYEFDENNEFGFHHIRDIQWIAKDLYVSPEKFFKKNISQQTIYEFYDKDIILDSFKELTTAEENEPKPYVLIIDEINRGNVSQIFGELITLIEADKRMGKDEEINVTLPYSKVSFGVPSNLFILGTMNTADRSVEALDTALRRRFSFIEMPPKPKLINTEGKAENGMVNGIELSAILENINKRIDKLLDKDHMIGHSYFLSVENLNGLKSVFHNKIVPLLQEYFFGDYGKIGLVIGSKFFDIQSDQVDEDFFAPFDDYDSSPLIERKVYHLKNIQEMSDQLFVDAINDLQRKNK
ncbi:AAA family ATPase [Zunongwangia atlantica]|uniref:ATPase n=1 Tax=Zunongwangia atlantica 22II14-10F7 TaxID=1185767 RepID=A0A1Y1T2Y8_9FLAO|nr:AAA family ATPase [Zunongwangia atlantica]ORL44964.1 ATPase [Zunongwangia atlantica 22II14-10F7]